SVRNRPTDESAHSCTSGAVAECRPTRRNTALPPTATGKAGTMSNVLQTPTVPRLVLARELSRFQYDDPAARRAVPRGELVRILRGIYADAAEWHAATPGERYLAMCRGYAASRA